MRRRRRLPDGRRRRRDHSGRPAGLKRLNDGPRWSLVFYCRIRSQLSLGPARAQAQFAQRRRRRIESCLATGRIQTRLGSILAAAAAQL